MGNLVFGLCVAALLADALFVMRRKASLTPQERRKHLYLRLILVLVGGVGLAFERGGFFKLAGRHDRLNKTARPITIATIPTLMRMKVARSIFASVERA